MKTIIVAAAAAIALAGCSQTYNPGNIDPNYKLADVKPNAATAYRKSVAARNAQNAQRPYFNDQLFIAGAQMMTGTGPFAPQPTYIPPMRMPMNCYTTHSYIGTHTQCR